MFFTKKYRKGDGLWYIEYPSQKSNEKFQIPFGFTQEQVEQILLAINKNPSKVLEELSQSSDERNHLLSYIPTEEDPFLQELDLLKSFFDDEISRHFLEDFLQEINFE